MYILYIYIYIYTYIYIYIYIHVYALFGGKNDVPGIFMPCVCVMHCRRRFFFGKSDVLVFLCHVIALLRSFYVPQALFLPANSDSQMALAIIVMGEDL